MRQGLPGEGRLLHWAHRRAYASPLGPRLHMLESAIPYGGAALVYTLLALLALKREQDRGPALVAMGTGVVAWIASDLAKLIVDRPRPCLDQISCGTHSFPEGPGVVLVAIAVAIWHRSRALAAIAALCALTDAAIQLGYGNHWPSDLVGAWLLGGICGAIVPRVAQALVRAREASPEGE